jgi:hypothetical protein
MGTALPAAAQDSDLVTLRRGAEIVGEVKSLRRGNLDFDTHEMDVVGIDWDDIAFLVSPMFFEVDTSSGEQYFGSLASTGDTAVLVVAGAQRSDTLAFQDVVEIGPIESGFWHRTNGFVDFGSNVAKANALSSVQLKGRFAYRGLKWGFSIDGDAYYQTQEATDEQGTTFTEETSRASLGGTLNRFLGASWVGSGSGSFETNDELDLDRRFLGIVGAQYEIIRNQGIELTAGAGAAYNAEQFTGEDRTTSGEAVLSAAFDVFDVGNIDVFTTVETFTNPADSRFRINLDGRVSWEIFSDFYLGFTATNRFDSNPPSETAETSDYQYGVTIGWSWS